MISPATSEHVSDPENKHSGEDVEMNKDVGVDKDVEVEVDNDDREKWLTHWDYLLTMVGYSVGFGNLWRFPYVCQRNGGGAFLIPYLIFLSILGFPMYALESGLGQFSGRNTLNVWSYCPLFRGCGIGSVIATSLNIPYYHILLAWPIYYLVKSFNTVLPWTTCGNEWNTPLCLAVGSNITNITTADNATVLTITDLWKNKSLSHTSVEEFFQYNVINVSEGIDDVGNVQWHIVAGMFAGYIVIFACLSRGVKSVGKVVYVTATLPYLLLIVIFIRTAMREGAVEGMIFYIKPDFNKLLTLQVWLEACLQVFYSLGPGWGLLTTAASYNKFRSPFVRDAMVISAISEGTSIFAGFVTFSILGVMANRVQVPMSEVVSSGPGLGFVAYPDALSQLPLPQLWSCLFFVMLITVGLDSQFLSVEVVLTALVDRYPQLLRKRRMVVLAAICIFNCLVGIFFCTQAGPYFFQIIDWYIGSICVFVICLLECLAASWFYGMTRLAEDMTMMLGWRLPVAIKIFWSVITPGSLMIAFILTLSQYQPPNYGKYFYPSWAIALGWFVGILPVLPLPICAVLAIRKHLTSSSLQKAVKAALQPDSEWKPISREHRQQHRENMTTVDHSFKSNLRCVFRK